MAAGQNIAALAVTGVTGTITDLAGNALSTATLPETFTGVIVDTTAPTVSSVTATAGDYDAGKVLSLTLNMSEAVNVTGTPTLTLNDGGTATYVSGTGTNALTFSYTVAAGQNIAALAVTGVTGTITDLAGNALSTASLPETFTGVVVDTTAPTVTQVVGLTLKRPRGSRRHRNSDANDERRGQRHRHADADAQRRWHRDLCQRLWQ